MSVGFELRQSGSKGEGIFATESFRIGDTVMIGVIEKELDKNHSHASQIGKDRFILHAGLITKVNHSCDPVCGIYANETGAHNFVAIKKINVNDEITFDYAMRNYDVDYFPKQCQCGAKTCRGKITGWKDLTNIQKKAYEGMVAPYLLNLDAEVFRAKSCSVTE